VQGLVLLFRTTHLPPDLSQQAPSQLAESPNPQNPAASTTSVGRAPYTEHTPKNTHLAAAEGPQDHLRSRPHSALSPSEGSASPLQPPATPPPRRRAPCPSPSRGPARRRARRCRRRRLQAKPLRRGCRRWGSPPLLERRTRPGPAPGPSLLSRAPEWSPRALVLSTQRATAAAA